MSRAMTGAEIREAFLRFFEERGHQRVPSGPLVPENDPTLLFSNAGMNQFKDVFTGQARLPFSRATSAQRCVRAGGKHNDLDSVGRTPRHNTFFEMLGNFSFGDYFKRDAITFAWDLVTGVFGLDPSRLWVTVYREDDEAAAIWQQVAKLSPERIVRLGEKDNFWAMGETGPCGPCSEILYDRGSHLHCGAERCGIGQCDCARWLEIWNLVFMQFDRAPHTGALTPLPRPSIDTGMGLERIASVLQGVDSNYDTDLLAPIVDAVGDLSGRRYDPGEAGFPFRVIADHIRACTFLVSDGVLPGNEGRSYVVRRVLRRAARFGRDLGLVGPFLWQLVPVVAAVMGSAYPEVVSGQEAIAGVIRSEEERFQETIADGMGVLDAAVAEARSTESGRISGEVAFRLYDTYGFPLDLTLDVAREASLEVDREGFDRALEKQRARARADRRSRRHTFGDGPALEDLPPTEFRGYGQLSAEGTVLAVVRDGQRVEAAAEGEEVDVVLDATPFYAEGGGQVGDQGRITTSEADLVVGDTRRAARGAFLHRCTVRQGSITVGDRVRAGVEEGRRRAIQRNHSATHLLHRALRETLGTTVHQAGSLVEPGYLRFDFTWDRPLTADQRRQIENLVNDHVLAGLPVEWFITGQQQARDLGAMALFGEKYGDQVRVVRMGEWSLELCGGTHVANTAEVGLFHLREESGIGSGVRRVQAVTGRGVLELLEDSERMVAAAADILRCPPNLVPERLQDVLARAEAARQQVAALRQSALRRVAERLLSERRTVGEGDAAFPVVAGTVDDDGTGNGLLSGIQAEELRTLADELRRRLGRGAVLLGSPGSAEKHPRKGSVLCALTPDLVGAGLHAGAVVKAAARSVGGSGGGKPDLATAGIPDADGLPRALEAGLRALTRV